MYFFRQYFQLSNFSWESPDPDWLIDRRVFPHQCLTVLCCLICQRTAVGMSSLQVLIGAAHFPFIGPEKDFAAFRCKENASIFFLPIKMLQKDFMMLNQRKHKEIRQDGPPFFQQIRSQGWMIFLQGVHEPHIGMQSFTGYPFSPREYPDPGCIFGAGSVDCGPWQTASFY